MHNFTQLKTELTELSAHLTFNNTAQAKSALNRVLKFIQREDPQWLTQALAEQSRFADKMRPHEATEPMEPTKYATGRVATMLGVETSHAALKGIYDRTRPHVDLAKAQRRYNEELATGEPLDGPPPLRPIGDNPQLCRVDEKMLLEREAQTGREYFFNAMSKKQNQCERLDSATSHKRETTSAHPRSRSKALP